MIHQDQRTSPERSAATQHAHHHHRRPRIPVPPRHYGGSERIVAALCGGLTEAGHQVRLVAGPGSRRYHDLIVHRLAGPSFLSRARRKILFQPLSLWAARDADVVHNYGRATTTCTGC